jgi:hypothetical protein
MDLRSKVLSGYAYTIKSQAPSTERRVNLQTGKGGVLLYIDACEQAGIPEEVIAGTIICHTDMGAYPLSALAVSKL